MPETRTHRESARMRASAFCSAYELRIPVLMAPMAGACPPALAAAVCNAGGMGAGGALLMDPSAIESWVSKVRAATNGAFQLNTWIPDPEPVRDAMHEAQVREFLGHWGPEVPEAAGDVPLIDFKAQCDAMIAASPRAISSIMGLYAPDTVARMKAEGIHWFATVTTVSEALAAEAAGADVLIAQGMEAGGHRGAFNALEAQVNLVGLFSLLPAVVDAVRIPVVATGGIADSRAIAAALTLGASAVQLGTGLLRSVEANTPKVLADAMEHAHPEDTVATTAFSGRLGRSLRSAYTMATADETSVKPAPYPIQRNLTALMRKQALESDDLSRMQSWAGQSAAYARDGSASDIVTDLWSEAQALLP
ncbi:MAG: NAD(P)H-dependent flavin oxidoreductase [Granulosicoccus sp.]